MRQFIIGLVLAAVLIGAILVAPRFLQPAAATASRDALREAELARRLLHSYDPVAPLAHERAQSDALRAADMTQVLAGENTQESLNELNQQFSAEVQAVRSSDQRSNIEPTTLSPVSTSPNGITSAIGAFDQFISEQQSTLQKAVAAARSAAGTSGGTPGVEMIQAMAKLTEARRSLAAATRVRTQLRTTQARAQMAAEDWARQQSEISLFGGIEVGPIVTQLGENVEQLNSDLAEARTAADELTATITQRDAELQQVRAELQQSHAEMLQLEDTGFSAGNDSSFNSYRDRLIALATRVGELQAREHMLASGGVEGGEYVQSDDEGGEIIGGEAFLGLDELRRRLSVLNDKVERYTSAVAALKFHQDTVGQLGTSAQEQERQFRARQQETRRRCDELAAQMKALAERASTLEDDALSAANAAVTSFGAAARAASTFRSDAASVQREFDAQGLNERLKLIARDELPEQAASTGEAETNTLIGRIYAERADGVSSYLATLDRIATMIPDVSYDAEALQSDVDGARTGGRNALAAAKDVYSPLAESDTLTSWVHSAALAGVEMLSARLDPAGADSFRQQASAALQTVFEKAGNASYTATYMQLRDALER